jgi:hypothetical protein
MGRKFFSTVLRDPKLFIAEKREPQITQISQIFSKSNAGQMVPAFRSQAGGALKNVKKDGKTL